MENGNSEKDHSEQRTLRKRNNLKQDRSEQEKIETGQFLKGTRLNTYTYQKVNFEQGQF